LHTNLHLFGQRTQKERLPVSGKQTPHKNKVDERAELMQTYNLLDNITAELVRRFGAIHSDIAVAVNTTHQDSTMFMETTTLKPHSRNVKTDHR